VFWVGTATDRLRQVVVYLISGRLRGQQDHSCFDRLAPLTHPPPNPQTPHTRSYEDNGDAVNNIVVLTQATSKSSIDDLGAPEKFLESLGFLLGRQSFAGDTMSEGGFAPNRVAAASLLDVSEATDKKGKKYYRYELVNRTDQRDRVGRQAVDLQGADRRQALDQGRQQGRRGRGQLLHRGLSGAALGGPAAVLRRSALLGAVWSSGGGFLRACACVGGRTWMRVGRHVVVGEAHA